MGTTLYLIVYLAAVAWVSYLPIVTTKKYDPPYFWRWAMLVTSSGPLLSVLTLIGFALVAPAGNDFDSFMLTGLFIVLLIIPFQLLVPMTVYLFICSSLKERRQAELDSLNID
jgi:hypothetical protein